MLPPICTSWPASRIRMRDQRCGGRLAVGAGDRDERRVGRVTLPLQAEQLDVADHADAGILRLEHGPVRHRMGQRHAGRQHQRREAVPRRGAQVGRGEAGVCGFSHARGVIIAGNHLGAAGTQRLAAREAGAAESKHRNSLAGKGRDGDHDAVLCVIATGAKGKAVHRSFRVDRPTSASTTEMIQNRITICGSVQPICSKW